MEIDKERVFTSVNTEEVREGSYGYFADTYSALKEHIADTDSAFYGKLAIDAGNEEQPFVINDSYHFRYFYLEQTPEEAKEKEKEVKYRPYKDIKEMFGSRYGEYDSLSYVSVLSVIATDSCFIVKEKGTNRYRKIDGVIFDDNWLSISGDWYYMEELFDNFEWGDGTVCGVKEGEQE